MAQTVSQPRPAAIAAVLAQSATWTSARRKSDGKSFFYIQGSTAGAVYMTAEDGCTCPAARNSRTGICKHQVAVERFRERQATTAAASAPKARKSYADLMPGCPDCGDLVERKGERCYHCGSEQVRNLDMARKRELVANL